MLRAFSREIEASLQLADVVVSAVVFVVIVQISGSLALAADFSVVAIAFVAFATKAHVQRSFPRLVACAQLGVLGGIRLVRARHHDDHLVALPDSPRGREPQRDVVTR
jgi:hypothetical protein